MNGQAVGDRWVRIALLLFWFLVHHYRWVMMWIGIGPCSYVGASFSRLSVHLCALHAILSHATLACSLSLSDGSIRALSPFFFTSILQSPSLAGTLLQLSFLSVRSLSLLFIDLIPMMGTISLPMTKFITSYPSYPSPSHPISEQQREPIETLHTHTKKKCSQLQRGVHPLESCRYRSPFVEGYSIFMSSHFKLCTKKNVFSLCFCSHSLSVPCHCPCHSLFKYRTKEYNTTEVVSDQSKLGSTFYPYILISTLHTVCTWYKQALLPPLPIFFYLPSVHSRLCRQYCHL